MATIRINSHGWFVIILGTLALFLFWRSSYYPVEHLTGEVISLRGLLVRCIHLSEKAGGTIKAVRQKLKLNTSFKSGGHYTLEPLTQADLVSHNTIYNGLKSAFPSLKLRSEERSTSEIPAFLSVEGINIYHSDFMKDLPSNDWFLPASALTVWIDPMDATKEFTEGLLEYVSVMLCVVLNGRPLIGIIHQPFINQTYWVWRQYGMSKNLLSLTNALTRARKATERSDNVTVIHSRSHLSPGQTALLSTMFSPVKPVLKPAAGSGFKVLSLLKGDADVYVHPSSIRRWDICAGHAILEAVGGTVSGLDGNPLTYMLTNDANIPEETGILAFPTAELTDRWKSSIVNAWGKRS